MEMETTVAAGTGADGPAAQHKVTDTPSRTAALDGGIPVGTTKPGGKSLLRQRQEAKALDAFGGSGAKVTDTASRTSGPDDGLRG